MPLTQLDPASALIIVDLQKGITAYPCAHPMDDIVGRAAKLATEFRSKNLPVVLVNVTGSAPGRNESGGSGATFPEDFAKFVPELDQQPGDIVASKQTWGAFTGTGLEQTLRDLNVTQVVICGVATSIGAESTARQAHEAGFHVTLVTDAMTDVNPEAHAHTVSRIFPRLGETGTTDEVLALLAAR
ncbi:isochorismatase family protein [Salipiger profundus]|uniref:isochorismatase family protein n=1 Tax=Salipiger profundus TaxID=1229727 RepID=UPI0008EC1449|nr:isochorismatase family protein [Salipiger profundus]SFD81040.1 Nicotinamidase-related amidase [Salipiger profundus]